MSLDTAAPPTPVDTKFSGGETASVDAASATQTSGHAKTGSTSAAAASTAAATSSPNPAAGNSGSNAGQQLTLRALVTSREAGIIIGKAGKNVADLREATGVRAGVSKVVPGVPDRVLTVTGTTEGIIKVCSVLVGGCLTANCSLTGIWLNSAQPRRKRCHPRRGGCRAKLVGQQFCPAFARRQCYHGRHHWKSWRQHSGHAAKVQQQDCDCQGDATELYGANCFCRRHSVGRRRHCW